MSEQLLAKSLQNLGTETAFEVLARAKALEAQGHDIVHLEIGEPDFDTPKNITEAAVKALHDGFTHYNPSAGMMETREAFAKYISKDRGVDVKPTQIVVTPGGKPIIFFTALALLDPGDEVVYPNPGFPIYESMIKYCRAKPVPIPLEEEHGFAFTAEKLDECVSDKTKLVIVNSPQNPTGGVLPDDVLDHLAELAVKHDFFILSDEIYSKIVYEGKFSTVYTRPGMPERTIILDGHSKTYAMTGWRLGFGVMPEYLAEKVAKLQTNCNSCTASFTQVAGVEALSGPQDSVKKMVEEFRTRRDLIVDGLNALPGFTCHKPSGAFYVFPNIKETGKTSKEMETFLMDKAGVAALAGTSFGKYGEGYIRFSYANSQENIKKALGKIADVL
jgi:aspartate/methionine/tyrosine aminotransferase